MKIQITALALLLASSAVQAENYLSLGTATYKARGEKFNGINIVYSTITRGGTGVIIQPQWVTSDSNGKDQKLLNASAGILIGVTKSDVLRIYPLVGMAYYKYSDKDESYSKVWPSVGVGVQVQLPNTNFFVDAGYKTILTIGKDKNDISAFSIGAGYRW